MNKTLTSMANAWKTSELSGDSSGYVDGLYEAYLEDPASVDASWKAYFDGLQKTVPGQADVAHEPIREAFALMAQQPMLSTSASGDAVDAKKLVAVSKLIYAYRQRGHRQANTDPLQLQQHPLMPELTLEYYGLSNGDLDQSFAIEDFCQAKSMKLRDIVVELKRLYCGTMGFEYMQVMEHAERNWLRDRIETKGKSNLSAELKKWLYQRLLAADGLEKYLGMKFAGQKRFSLEGGDALIPIVDHLVHEAAAQGVQDVMMGMAHRGRLNVLVNVVGKSPENLVGEFEGKHHKELLSGDVKYHNGFSVIAQTRSGPIHVALAFNPSHLEIVSPVVSGSVRARQDRTAEQDRSKVLPILMHGDAAFTGQGVVMEAFNMSQTRGFNTAGAVHVVINNQVGFTTSNPDDARSGPYCTDIAKMIEAPVFHVNGDDAEAVLFVTQLALDYRMQFHKDVVIDLVCYRLHGHNESDEPSGTQPVMYRAIKTHLPPYQVYAQQLQQEGVLSSADAEQMVKDYRQRLEAGKPVVSLVQDGVAKPLNWTPYLGVPWNIACSTQVDKKVLVDLSKRMEQLPVGFSLQPQVAKTLTDRQKMATGEVPLNWGGAEVLAYASLINEGYSLRLCGQDCGRGTFSHRHAVLHHYQTGETYIPLQHIKPEQPRVEIIDSVLSEEAVLAYEYGYSCSAPKAMVIWEAQFGDFANGAQVVIDQFISSAEEKWGRLSGLTLFLPHGYEGMGAEHSSARLERFLQLCAHDNMQVCVPTTPAQHFHLIRRQMVRPYRKPLVVMTPKSLLRHPLVTSTMDELAQGEFQTVLDEIDAVNLKKLKRVVFCQGKVYYDLLTKRREAKIDDVALVRIEQLYPFPEDAVKAIMKKYANVQEWVWCQEEPQNQGAWWRMQWFLEALLPAGQRIKYVGRESFAAPAAGYPQLHKAQQAALVNGALNIKE
jgi:2-oxoglutarate dehydrogenase E1 component